MFLCTSSYMIFVFLSFVLPNFLLFHRTQLQYFLTRWKWWVFDKSEAAKRYLLKMQMCV